MSGLAESAFTGGAAIPLQSVDVLTGLPAANVAKWAYHNETLPFWGKCGSLWSGQIVGEPHLPRFVEGAAVTAAAPSSLIVYVNTLALKAAKVNA